LIIAINIDFISLIAPLRQPPPIRQFSSSSFAAIDIDHFVFSWLSDFRHSRLSLIFRHFDFDFTTLFILFSSAADFDAAARFFFFFFCFRMISLRH
jgi:hypothetical protein